MNTYENCHELVHAQGVAKSCTNTHRTGNKCPPFYEELTVPSQPKPMNYTWMLARNIGWHSQRHLMTWFEYDY